MLDANDQSPLQEKLEIIAEQIGNFGIAAAVLTIAIIWIKVSYQLFKARNNNWADGNLSQSEQISKYVEAIIIAISVIVCAIPEGLPLAVTISLAYSVRKMMDDNNLVKKINSCETMGNADCICTDKTGTLTENLMTIKSFWYAGEEHAASKAKETSGF